VWTGFALILFASSELFYLLQAHLPVEAPGEVLVTGMAFRNREGFKEEFEKLKGRLGCS